MHGKQWDKLVAHVSTHDKSEIKNQAKRLKKKFERDHNLLGADILPILQKKSEKFANRSWWTQDEYNKLIEGIREYGRGDWNKVTALVATKNKNAVCHKAESLKLKYKLSPDLPGADILPLLESI